MISEDLKNRVEKIKLVAMDVDGVLTDGRMIYGNFGDELKFFDVQDGLGCKLLTQSGLKLIIITSKKSRINDRRAKEVGATKLYQNVSDKLKVFDKVLRKYKVDASEACYVGDDLVDLSPMLRAGLAVAVQNAVAEVKDRAHYVTQKKGGRGAAREVAELILKTQRRWVEVTERFTRVS